MFLHTHPHTNTHIQTHTQYTHTIYKHTHARAHTHTYAKGLGQYISGAILFEETLYQSCSNGKKMSEMLIAQGIVPGIKVDKGLAPLPNSNGCVGVFTCALTQIIDVFQPVEPKLDQDRCKASDIE